MLHKHVFRGVVATLSAIVLMSLVAAYSVLMRPNVLVRQPAQWLIVPHGTSFSALQEKLRDDQYLDSTWSFGWTARLLKYDQKVRPGAYKLEPNMSNWATVRMLRAGLQQPVHIVLNNIKDKQALAQQITKRTCIPAADFEALLNTPDFVERYGFDVENILTMFIPNTYEVYWTITAEELFARMYKEYQRFWNQQRRDRAQEMGLTPIQVSVLASIVQCELVKPAEAPIIAGVFINRLKRRMRLQSDATVYHLLSNQSVKRVLYTDTKIKSVYNTYRTHQLPPGPIVMPHIVAIDAVLNYAKHNYLYFSAKEDFSGEHYFARSFEQHKKNAQRYRRALNSAQIYR